MEKYHVLYEIRSLEKLLIRSFICDHEIKTPPTPTQMQIVEYILSVNTEVYQKDLEAVLNLRRATVSGVLQTMEKNNLIERVATTNDARVKQIILHPRTKKLFLEHQRKLEQIEKIIIKNIDKKDLEAFSSVLNTMKKNIKEYSSLHQTSVAVKEERRK